MPIPLFSLLIGYILYRILKNQSKGLIWLSITFALAIQCHLSIFIFLPLIVSVIFIKRKLFSRRIILISLAIFILLQLPLIIFDLRHNFLNSRAGLNIILGKNQAMEVSSFQERSSLFLSSLGRFMWLPAFPDLFSESGQCKELAWLQKRAYPESILFVLSGIAIFIVWYFFKESKKGFFISGSDSSSAIKVLSVILLQVLLFIVFYERKIFEYYFLFFFPWLAIILGNSLDFIWQKEHGRTVVIPIIIVFISLNLLTLFTADFSYAYKDKIAALDYSKKT